MRRPLRSDEARSVANLAIDLGDPGRMSRARRLHRSNGVSDVDVVAGVARATVADAEGELHEVSISVANPTALGQPPVATDLVTTCSCDDDSDTCTHALAALLGVAEEIEANGRLLALWAGEAPTTTPTVYEPDAGAGSFFDGRWSRDASQVALSSLRFEHPPALRVDDVDAGPVMVDAIGAIRRGLSRYRAHG